MIGWKFEFGTLSDLSATIFSVFLLLLVLLLDTALNPQSASSGAEAIERAPLGAGAMADLLYQRRLSAPGTRIDIMSDRLVVTASPAVSGNPLASVQNASEVRMTTHDLQALLREGQGPDPISLYVFANDLYQDVANVLHNQGRSWREISVPSALKQNGQGEWVNAFRVLLDRPTAKGVFIGELAEILGGGAKNTRGNSLQPGSFANSQYNSLYERISYSLRSLWTDLPIAAIINILIGLCGVCVVVWVEKRFRSALPRL